MKIAEIKGKLGLRFENASDEKINEKVEKGEVPRLKAPLLEEEDISFLS